MLKKGKNIWKNTVKYKYIILEWRKLFFMKSKTETIEEYIFRYNHNNLVLI